MNNLLKKTVLAMMIAALALAVLPFASVLAAGKTAPDEPPAQGLPSNARLEQIWARELKAYQLLGRLYDPAETLTEKIQNRIDRAAENGKDVTSVQAALDAFEAAVKQAHPIYESAAGIVNSHKGFDENGLVTDSAQAEETVRDMGGKLKEIKNVVGGAAKALREAIRAFREANRPAE